MNNTKFPYAVEITLNKARTPKQFRRFKTLRAASIFLYGVSRHTIFVDGYIIHTSQDSKTTVILELPEKE